MFWILLFYINIFSVSCDPIALKTFNDFKTLLMYFNESLLTDAKVKDFHFEGGKRSKIEGASFEGNISDDVGAKICNLIQDSRELLRQDAVDFGVYLQNGMDIYSLLKKFSGNILTIDLDYKNLDDIQGYIMEIIRDNGKIVLPSGWKGNHPHAIGLIIERSDENLENYNLIVVNSGDGLNFHNTVDDPNYVYPWLSRLWIEFKNIPQSIIFDDSHWFIRALLLMNHNELFKKIENEAGNGPTYFYGSILANFREYLIEPDFIDKDKLMPEQRSGSCVVSSLMACMLYFAKNEESFHYNRVVLGQKLLESFLDNYESDPELHTLITDSFDTISRKLFNSISASLARQVFMYLEKKYPNIVIRSGLLGSQSRSWIKTSKIDVIDALNSDTETLNLLMKSLNLGLKVKELLKYLKINENSAMISEPKEFIHRKNIYLQAKKQKLAVDSGKSALKLLIQEIERTSVSISNLNQLESEMNRCLTQSDLTSFTCILDAFRKCENLKWWEMFDASDVTKEYTRDFLNLFVTVLKRLCTFGSLPVSLDNFVLLAHLQIGLWKAALTCDNLEIDPKLKLELSNFSPPPVLETVLKTFSHLGDTDLKCNYSISSGAFQHWPIITNFSASNLKELGFLLKAYRSLSAGEEYLSNPVNFISEDSFTFKRYEEIHNLLMSRPFSKKLHEKIFDNQEFKSRLYNSKLNRRAGKAYESLNAFLNNQELFKDLYPQYYGVLNGSFWIYLRSRRGPLNIANQDQDHVFNNQKCSEDQPVFCEILEHSTYKDDFIFHGESDSNYSLIPSIFTLKLSGIQENIFCRFKHSQVYLNGPSLARFESWLNYIKGAQDASIFDDVYFLYLSDRILNMPIIQYNEETDEIDMDINVTYFDGFNTKHTEAVYNEFIRLIMKDIDYLLQKKTQLNSEEAFEIVERTGDLGIILARFIERIDVDYLVSEDVSASMLLKLYKILFNYLGNNQSNVLQTVLTLICSVKIRNPELFMENLDFKVKGTRKSLARVHWFLAKNWHVNYNVGKSQIDDVFSNGFIFHPVTKSEIPFMTELLKKLFLSNYEETDNLDNWTVKYSTNGDLVQMKNADKSFIIQLSSGRVIKNGFFMADKRDIMNVPLFRDYFTETDEFNRALEGELLMIGSFFVYTVTDFNFKGNTIVMICNDQVDCSIYRKHEGYWYAWEKSTSNFEQAMTYKWYNGYKIYSRIPKENLNSFAILKNDQPYMLVEFEKDLITQELFMNLANFSQIADMKFKLIKGECDRHFKVFTETKVITAIFETRFIYVFPAVRFFNDKNRPLTIFEDESGDLRVLNRSDLIIERKQIALKDVGIRGTLVGRNVQGQRILLLAVEGKDKIFLSTKRSELTQIEEIPIIDDYPAPQTLKQKLLLAFVAIKSHEYMYAKDLLHPFTSIAHNEPFASKELEILAWIVMINNGDPEAAVLKYMAHIHMKINERKFPLEYSQNNLAVNLKSSKTEDSLDEEVDESPMTFKNQKQIILEKLKDESEKALYQYFMSIRDLSEKFYIHRMFPDFFNQELISKFLVNNMVYKSLWYENSSVCANIQIDMNRVEELGVEFPDINVYKIFHAIGNKIYGRNGMKLEKYLNLTSRLLVRQKKYEIKSKCNEMVVYCAAKNPGIFDDVAKRIFKTSSINSSEAIFKDLVEKCADEFNYKNDFYPIDLSHLSLTTNHFNIYDTLKEDSNKNKDSEILTQKDLQVVTGIDLVAFAKISDILQSYLGTEIQDYYVKFDALTLYESKVLRKLYVSIKNFMENKGNALQSDMNINEEIKESLVNFTTFLTRKIEEVNNFLNEMLMGLSLRKNDNILERLNRQLHGKKDKTFGHLYACYQRQSISCLQNKFQQFSRAECEKLLREISEFYGNQVFLDYMNMLKDLCDRFMDQESISIDELTSFLDELEKIKHFNSRLSSPSILNFEYRSRKYRLRSEQVKDIKNFTEIDRKSGLFKSLVIQRMMAAGKTLVLGTISAITKAMDKTKLSILVPPSALYQNNTTAMQARTYSYFKSRGKNFHFPRFQFHDLNTVRNLISPFMESLLTDLKSTMNSRDYMILSPDTLSSFLNSYIELVNKIAESEQVQKDIEMFFKKYSAVYELFRTKSSIILDEIDMTMDPKKELNFPTNEFESYNMFAVALLTDLIEFSVFDEEVKSTGLNILNNNQSSLTSESYENYREILFKYISEQLETSGSPWNIIFTKIDRGKAMELLRNSDFSVMRDWIQELYETDQEMTANALIIVKVQLWRGLKTFMKSEVNSNYGAAGSKRSRIEYAVPYLAANTLSPNSEFADRWETLIKTILMLAATPCTEIIAKNMIDYLKQSIMNETSPTVPQTETVAYKNITVLIPDIDIVEMDSSKSEDVQLIHRALKTRSPAAIRILFSYAVDEIISKMTFPVEQITSNALNMVSMFGSIQGYSGTIDNVNILPHELIVEADKDNLINEDNNGGIALKLIKDSENKPVMELEDEDFMKSILEIIEKIIDEPSEISALIDVGAFFKNYKNRKVAETILTVLAERIEVVLYYDEISNQVEFVRSRGDDFVVGHISSTDPDVIQKATQADLKKRFTFYDQRHITGSDILQPKHAHALMTVGPRVLLRDILQGTLRMRQFMTTQKVHMITSAATSNFYYSKTATKLFLTVSDLLALGALNEDEKQSSENQKLAFEKINNLMRKFILDLISLSENSDRILITRKFLGKESKCRSLFVRNIKENPIDWMVREKEMDSHEVISTYAEKWLSEIRDKCEELNLSEYKRLKKLQREVDEMTAKRVEGSVETILNFLDETIIMKSDEKLNGVEVEMKLVSQNHSEINLAAVMNPVEFKLPPVTRKKLNLETIRVKRSFGVYEDEYDAIGLNDLLNPENMKTKEQKLMAKNAILTDGTRISVTKDLVRMQEIDEKLPCEIFSEMTWEGSHFLIFKDQENSELDVILLSTEAAEDVYDNLKRATFDKEVWLCDLSGAVSASNTRNFNLGENIMDLIPESANLIFDLLIFNGSFDQILSSQPLENIFWNDWLKGSAVQYRALFLLTRMHLLARKDKYIFASDCKEVQILENIARGEIGAIGELGSGRGIYRKHPVTIEEELNHPGPKDLRAAEKDINRTIVDQNRIFMEISELSRVPANIRALTDLDEE